MEVRPLKVSPSPAARPVPSGQADCVPKPLKVIIRLLKRRGKLNRQKWQLSFLHECLVFCDDLLVFVNKCFAREKSPSSAACTILPIIPLSILSKESNQIHWKYRNICCFLAKT